MLQRNIYLGQNKEVKRQKEKKTDIHNEYKMANISLTYQ